MTDNVTETATVAGIVDRALDPATLSPAAPAARLLVEGLVVALIIAAVIAVARRLRGRSAPAVEAAAGFAFVAAGVVRLSFLDDRFRVVGAALLVVLAAVFLVTVGVEIFWGVAVRFDPAFAIGTQVVIDDLEGRVRRLRARWVELETSDGWLVRVPYRRLYRGVRVRRAGHRTAVPVRFELELEADRDVAAARARARELVLCSPWSNLSPAPEVEIDEAGRSVLKVEAYTFGREGRSRLVADVVSAWTTTSK